jgi:endonuclease YncB( thermonuclease family)
MRRPLAIGLILALAPAIAVGAELIPGPINARVVSVYDGDTLTVDAAPWPGLTARTSVRVAKGGR